MTDTATAVAKDTPTAVHKIAGEVLGTFVLVFFGCGAALISGGDYVATALAFGLTVVVMAYAVGRITGGHFNPAVTIGAALGGRLPWREVVLYIGSQLVGAVAAGVCLWVLMHGFPGYDSTTDGLAQNFYGDQGATDYAWWAAFLLEMLMTFVFIMIILAVTDSRIEHPVMAPLAIGLALAMIHFASINATGTSVNPARSIGVGLFAGTDAIIQLWLFILAPLLGGALAGLLYPVLFGGDDPVPGSGRNFGRTRPGAVPGYGAPDQYQQQWNQPDAHPTAQYPHPDHQQQQYQQPPPQQYGAYQYGEGQYPPQQQYQQPPAQQYPPQQYPPQGYPQQGYPPQGYPQQGYPQQGGWDPQAAPPPQQPQETPPQEYGQPAPEEGDGQTQVRPQDP